MTPDITTNEYKQRDALRQHLNVAALPQDLRISTMTIIGKFPTCFNVINIYKCVNITPTGIISAKYGKLMAPRAGKSNSVATAEDIASTKLDDMSNRTFYNSITCVVYAGPNKYVNIKLFRNGSIQMTGVRSVDMIFDTLNIVICELSRMRGIYDPKQQKIIAKPFVSDITGLHIDKLYDINTVLINSNFDLSFKVDRAKLHNMITRNELKIPNNQNFTCNYDPALHSSVDFVIFYNTAISKKINVFVFESGSVMITGGREFNTIKLAYEFINRLLLMNYYLISKTAGDNILKYIEKTHPKANKRTYIANLSNSAGK